MFDIITKQNQIIYLEIHNTKDGMNTFKCGTRYDWYILQKNKNENHKTKIIDQNNISYEINLNKYNWLANCDLELIDKLIANENEENCQILYSRSNYGSDKKWVSKIETIEYKYPLIHSTPKNGIRYYYSSRNDNGHFGISKVIFGDSGIYNSIIDIDGKYGMTEHAMAIQINNIEEGCFIKKIIESKKFKDILNACSWSNFQIDWRLFTYFKKDFWKEFI